MPLPERESVADPLTGAFNRRYLERRMQGEYARARRHALPFSLLAAAGSPSIQVAGAARPADAL